ncbi:hypothetical protein FEM33_01580 [Dyadobacter flavalbus]|uniref:Uncharacterized protein n=1 Tax=Dyadobacter flavalbus TaxID=2579942 RepID=A0A5M8R1B6_9BACT|nr:hypothetical protein [Dyadobacter flavalbus]KAA6441451.1 hypothetical protein FEM33_01580 [Dyadobacter flavalbus]
MGDPFGYQKEQLYGRNNKVTTLRTQTHAEMVADSLRNSGNPKFYVIDIDEENGNAQDVLYWWDGIALTPIATTGSIPFVNAPTYAAAVALTSTLPGEKLIPVAADETQNGAKALYYWNTTTLQEILLL